MTLKLVLPPALVATNAAAARAGLNGQDAVVPFLWADTDCRFSPR